MPRPPISSAAAAARVGVALPDGDLGAEGGEAAGDAAADAGAAAGDDGDPVGRAALPMGPVDTRATVTVGSSADERDASRRGRRGRGFACRGSNRFRWRSWRRSRAGSSRRVWPTARTPRPVPLQIFAYKTSQILMTNAARSVWGQQTPARAAASSS